MGDQKINPLSGDSKSTFLRRLIHDIEALDWLVEQGKIEQGVTRIGAEQEFCLVTSDLRPSTLGPQVLRELKDPHFTAELAKWNLEINLDPFEVGPGCLNAMNDQLRSLLDVARQRMGEHDTHVILAGILPTIRKSDLEFDNMTPNPRYRVLDTMFRKMRGEDFFLNVEGVDEIKLRHQSILFEACNTSFQVHLQIDPTEFADRYNWAQVISAPVLAASVNSPVLLGKELWSETRIALFRQSIDVRNAGRDIRDQQPRVAFGNDWLNESATEIFKNDVANYYPLFSAELEDEDSLDRIRRGEIPSLRAMNLHNGTIYKWNRACYGVHAGTAHLRIENRYLPSGPTPDDEIANTTFWVGLMLAMPEDCRGDWSSCFHFPDIRSNFMRAAQYGLGSEFYWFGKRLDAGELILEKLLPLAATGLQRAGIPESEFEPWLTIVKNRVANRQTGAEWIVRSLRLLNSKHNVHESTLIITEAIRQNCVDGPPISEWELPQSATLVSIPDRYARVESIMRTDLVTVRDNDPVEFADKLMKWRRFHHLPVEEEGGYFVGIVSATDLERFRGSDDFDPAAEIASIMIRDSFTVAPEDSLPAAERLMQKQKIGSLPVVRDRRVIGIVTVRDIERIAGLREGSKVSG